jgi:hypothetical protein
LKSARVLAGLALLAGCSTHPITGREQIIALPLVQTVHADLRFALSAGTRREGSLAECETDCGDAKRLAVFTRTVAEAGRRLELAARELAPELFDRIEGFQVEVSDGLDVGTGSNAGGRIVLGSGLAALEPTDAVIAFLVAREMAHVIARHAEENSGASIVFSLLGMLLPGFSAIARLVASAAGSSALTSSWAAQQQREADEIAMTLLEIGGMPASVVALELDIGISRARLPDGDWGARYLESARRADIIARQPPRYAGIRD